jgi:2-iminobutanoate/2-iminopropanoate deaminase
VSKKNVGAELGGVLAPAVLVEDRFLYVSGHGPLRDGEYTPDSIEAETRLTLANLEATLAAAGSSLEQVVRVGVFLADLDDLGAMNAVYAEVFQPPRPARTTVGVAALPGGIKVEIDCVALVGGSPA